MEKVFVKFIKKYGVNKVDSVLEVFETQAEHLVNNHFVVITDEKPTKVEAKVKEVKPKKAKK